MNRQEISKNKTKQEDVIKREKTEFTEQCDGHKAARARSKKRRAYRNRSTSNSEILSGELKLSEENLIMTKYQAQS